MTCQHPPRFLAESTLGKLVKYLRLAGLDTIIDRRVPDARQLGRLAADGRIVLTRSRKVAARLHGLRFVFITSDDAPSQFAQVLLALGLDSRVFRPLTRCAVCNHLLEAMSREDVRGRVPDYVWDRHEHFRSCPQCARIYWPGTHARRWLSRIASFDRQPE